MPTDVVKSIGTGGDYTSIQAWEDAAPADLVSADQRWIGELKNQTFTSGVTISGSTVDSTRYKYLRCETGASFSDNASVRTNALRYNTANGAAIETNGSAITLGENYVRLEGLQLYRTTYSGDGVLTRSGGDNYDISQCIIKGTVGHTADFGSPNSKFRNCLFECYGSGLLGVRGQMQIYGCTIVNTGTCTYGLTSSYNNALLKNSAIFGFATGAVNGTTRAGSDYNATDAASVGTTGSNNLTSLTYSNQVESTTNDFRAKSTGDLQAGTPDATNTPEDITGLTRNATTPWIGCWEVAAAGGGAVFNASWCINTNKIQSVGRGF